MSRLQNILILKQSWASVSDFGCTHNNLLNLWRNSVLYSFYVTCYTTNVATMNKYANPILCDIFKIFSLSLQHTFNYTNHPFDPSTATAISCILHTRDFYCTNHRVSSLFAVSPHVRTSFHDFLGQPISVV